MRRAPLAINLLLHHWPGVDSPVGCPKRKSSWEHGDICISEYFCPLSTIRGPVWSNCARAEKYSQSAPATGGQLSFFKQWHYIWAFSFDGWKEAAFRLFHVNEKASQSEKYLKTALECQINFRSTSPTIHCLIRCATFEFSLIWTLTPPHKLTDLLRCPFSIIKCTKYW